MKKNIIYLLLLFTSIVFSQTYNIATEDGNTGASAIFDCTGTFVDSGGTGGSYSNNENYSVTFCPDTPGDQIVLDFNAGTFSVEGGSLDFLTIYNGDTTGSPLYGTFTGNPGVISSSDPSGCLTIVFESDSSLTYSGWEADISCQTPCTDTIVANLVSTSPSVNGSGVITICQGDTVDFVGSGTFSGASAGSTYDWNFGNGTVGSGTNVTATFDNPGVFLVNLDITNGLCQSTNNFNQIVQVSPTPDFTGTSAASGTLCLGQSTDITGVAVPQVASGTCAPPLVQTTFLPDSSNAIYTTCITVDCYGAGDTVTSASDIVNIFAQLEHTFIGDLEISVTAPNGANVVIHTNDFGGTNLGDPINTDGTGPGVGWDYYFLEAGSTGTDLIGAPTVLDSNGELSFQAGSYDSDNTYAGFIGSPLNGDWCLVIEDTLSADDGYIFAWNVNFDPAIAPIDPNLTFTQNIVSSSWVANDANGNITNTVGDVITVQPTATGVRCYTYTVVDSFGCSYDQQVCINVNAGATADASVVVSPICSGDDAGFTISGTPNAVVTYNINGGADQTITLDGSGNATVPPLIGVTVNQTINLISVVTSGTPTAGDGLTGSGVTNSANAEGVINPVGTALDNTNSAQLAAGANSVLTLILDDVVPIGTSITLAIAQDTGAGDMDITDGVNTVNFAAGPVDISQYITFVTGVATNTLTFTRNAGRIWVDGAEYTIATTTCTVPLTDSETVTVNPAVDAGLDGALTLCATGTATDLFGQLLGTPQAGGVWSPAMASGTGVFDPAVDTAGTFTYTVTGLAPCAPSVADVVVTVTAAPDAGLDGTLVACDSDGTTDLFGQLLGTPDAGGVWTPALTSGTGVFDPSVDAAGTYTYTINIAGCVISDADVVVTVNPAVDAGLDGALTLCATGTATDLFGQLLGTPQAGGVWSPAMASGTGVFDPAVDTAGTFTYTVTGVAPCAPSVADVVVTVTAAPDAGLDGTLVACDSDGTTDLFGQLLGTPDAGGVWTPALTSGTGVFDPSVDAAGTYTYTINIAGCVISDADVVVTVNPAVDAGLDGALTLCATGTATDLFGQLLGTPQAGGVWSPAMASGTGVFDPAVDTAGTFTYTVTGLAPCAPSVADVVVTVTAAPDAGLDGTLVACDSDGTTDLFGQLLGTPDAGGVWTPALTSGTGVFDPSVDAAGTYTYTINIAGCVISDADVVVTVNPAVDAGLDGALTLCATGTATDLFGQLLGTPQAGGVWSPAMASGTGVFDPAVDTAGTFTYTVTGVAPCAPSVADVVVTVTAAPDAGLDGTLVACDSDGTTDLFGQLLGTPDAGGVWTPALTSGTGVFDPSVDAAGTYTYTINIAGCVISDADVVVTVNPAVDAGLDGALTLCATGTATDLFGQLLGTPQAGGVWSPAMASGTGVFDPAVDTAGTFTYTVTGVAPCAPSVADVVVTVTAAPDAGLDGTLVACDSDGTTDLFGQLLGTPDAGGVWTPALTSGTGVFDPSVDAAGTYTYTINIAGCVISDADVVVTVNPAVDAGLDGALTLCATGTATDLFGQLLGTPQAGGVWSPAMASGTGVFDPAVDTAGTFTYTVTGLAPCAPSVADVVVTVTAAPDAGLDGTLVACDSDGTTDLFGQLLGTPDAGGVWTPALTSGTGVFDPSVDAAGTYTYTINIAGCVISDADVVVTVNPAVDAGLDGALTLCATGTATDLFGQLLGTPQAGGVWSPAMASGTGVFDPAVDTAGTFTYTVTGLAPCAPSVADVVVTVTAAPDAGLDGTLVACDSDGTTDLFGQLLGTPDAGGVWTPALTSGTGVFDPSVDAAGTYTYTINIAGCVISDADVVVTVNPAVDAGLDGALTLCATGTATDLFGQLLGTPQAGGVWSPAMASGTGVFDPAVDTAGTFTYTVTGVAPCAPSVADVVVTVTAAPDAGLDGTLVACDSDGTTDLFGQLLGTPDAGGVWTPALTSGTGVFDPSVDAAGTYTYTINIAGCVISDADVVVTVNPAVDAGLDGALTLCATGTATDLFGQLLGTPQAGGVWSPAMASGTGVFDPAVDTAGTFTYTVTGLAPCAPSVADVVVTVTAAPDAGLDGTLVACDSDGTTDLFGQLLGTPDAGGVWTPALTSGTGVFDPSVDAAGTYTYTINIAGCVISDADVVVTVNPAVDAGLDGALTLCATGTATDLFGQLLGTPQAGGVWSPAMASGTGVFDPAVDTAGTFTYTVTGVAPCAPSVADVVVTVTAAPDAGLDGTLVACDSDGTTDLFGQLLGTPDAGGVWTPALTSGTGVFDPSVDAAGTYTYTINIAGCVISDADVVVTVNPAVDAGLDGALTLCATGTATDLFGQLLGTPQAGGVWSPAMASGTGVFDPAVDTAGTFTYTVTGLAPCAPSVADVVVTVTAAPDAGLDGTLVACDSDGTTDLFGQLLGTPDAGGVWTPALTSGTGVFDPSVDAAGTYTYTINIAGCVISDADVVVTVNPAVDAGLDGALTLCATGTATDLFGQLLGTPQAGGVWSPAMASGTGVFDPAVDTAGTFTYTVTGLAPCAPSVADVVVTVTAAPDAGLDGTLVACDSDGTTDLFGQLLGTPDAGGVWTPALTSGTGVFDPSVDAAGTYTYTINIAGCVIVDADVVVTVNPAVDAGLDGALTLCATGTATDLFGQLLGTPQAGGVWSPAMASGTGVFDPAVDTAGTFTYTVTGLAPCAPSVADVVVTVTAAPDAGLDGTLVACDSDGTTDLFGQLLGTPDAGGVWSPAMASGTGVFDPTVDAGGTYTYTINIAGCAIESADVVVTVHPTPEITSLTNNTDICAEDDAIFTIVGTADATVSYSYVLDGGAPVASTVVLDALGNGTVTVATPGNNTTAITVVLTLNDILNTTTTCNTALMNTSTVTVNPNPEITSLTNNTDICAEDDAIFTIVGTADTTVSYSYVLDGGAPVASTVVLDALGNGTVTVATPGNNTTAITVVLTLNDILNTTTTCNTALMNTSTVTVNPNPEVTSLTNNTDICAEDDAIFTIVGTADTTVSYSYVLDGGAPVASTVVLDALGNGTVTVATPANNTTAITVVLTLNDILNTTTTCNTALMNTSTVTVNPNPEITSLTNNTDICAEDDAIFTIVGTADTTVSYSYVLDGGAPVASTVVLDALGNGTVTVATPANNTTAITVVLTLNDILNTTTTCNTALMNTSTVTVNPNPEITSLTNNTDICAEDDAIFTIVGTADTTVSYSYVLDGGAPVASTVVLDALGNGTVTVATPVNNTTAITVVLTLNDILNTTTTCNTALMNTSTVTVNPNPEVTSLTNNTDICAEDDAIFTIVGTADTTVSYSYVLDGGAPVASTVVLDALGNGTVTVATPANNTTAITVILTLSDILNTTTTCNTALTNTSTVTVNPNPIVVANQNMQLCDDDLDGLMPFDLTSNSTALTAGATGVIVTFYDNPLDAQNNTNNLTDQSFDVSAYVNTNPTPPVSVQTIYVGVMSDLGCYSVTEFTITVNTPIANNASLSVCDTDNDNFNQFVLADAINVITGGNTNLMEVSFFETLAEAQVGLGAINDASNPSGVYANLANPQIIFVNVLDTVTGCSYIGSELVLNVLNAPETPEFLTYNECDYYGDVTDGVIEFDLASYETSDLYATIIANGGVTTDYTTTYYTGLLVDGSPDLATVISSPYVNTVNDQIIYAVVTSNLNIDSNNSGCTSMTAITLHVEIPPTTLLSLIPISECDDNDDGFLSFDLTSHYAEITNDNLNDITIVFYEHYLDLTTSPITVDVTSIINDPSNFTNVIAAQTIFAELTNNITGCVTIVPVTLTVDSLPTPLEQVDIDDMSSCVNDGNGPGSLQDGFAIFDLASTYATIVNNEPGVTLTYYTSEADANAGDIANAIPNADLANFYNTVAFGQTIWVRDEDNVTGCYVLVYFDIDVPVPNVSVSATTDVLCIDENGVPLTSAALPVISATTTSGLLADYTFQWYINDVLIPGETNDEIAVTQEGTYTVVMADMQDNTTSYDDTLCVNMDSTTITVSAMPDDFNANVTTNAFADNQQIVATATSSVPGVVFIYNLDGLEQNTTGVFDNVAPGSHIVTITDGKGCWSEDVAVFVIDYPKFFSPNGDGINDYWAIIGQEGIPISQIYIFDRFGKLLKQLDPDSLGWDGTYNGNPLPATDYWFKIIYIEGAIDNATQKEFKAHFSLIR